MLFTPRDVYFLIMASCLLTFCGAGSAISRIDALHGRVEKEQPPIFDFKERLDEIFTVEEQMDMNEEDLLSCELVFNHYVDKLRDHYFEVFEDYVENENQINKLKQRMSWCENECKVAMSSATPDSDLCNSWSYQGTLEELKSDMEKLIDSRSPMYSAKRILADSSRKSHRWRLPFKLPPRFKKSSKWIVSQSLLLLLNFLQSEWNRRSSRNLAAKRWADVPGFPVL